MTWTVSPNIRFVGPEGAPICELIGDRSRREESARLLLAIPKMMEALQQLGVDASEYMEGGQ